MKIIASQMMVAGFDAAAAAVIAINVASAAVAKFLFRNLIVS